MSIDGARRRGRRLAGALTGLALSASVADAAEFSPGAASLSVAGAITLGTAVRLQARDAGLLPNANSSQIGVAGAAPGGRNQDDGNLNFARGDAVSTVLKGYADVDARWQQLGLFGRIKFWHDFVLADHGMPWGNYANGYAAGQPLGEAGFAGRARFSGAVIEDAYVEGRFAPGGAPLYLRLGRQVLPWGGGFAIAGGVDDLNPVDGPASRRPGALAAERLIAVPAAWGRLELSPEASAEWFGQFRFEPHVLTPCGTFHSTLDYMSPGCERIWVVGTNDRNVAGSLRRSATPAVTDSGQYGLAFSYRSAPLATTFGVTAAQYHSRMPFVSMVKGAAPLTARYFTEYPERLRLLALEFTTLLQDTRIKGAVTHRPRQPVQLNGSDLFSAFAVGAGLLSAAAAATPTGAAYHGYDLLRTTQLQLAVSRRLRRVMAAASATVSAEIGVKRVHDLPDVGARRFRRPDVFGIGPVPGTACAGPAETCSSDGFVSATAWGYRLRAELAYPEVVSGVGVKPGLSLGHDVRGWSADGVFSEGRKLAGVWLRAEFGKRYFSELALERTWGGVYDSTRDRDFASLVVGLNF